MKRIKLGILGASGRTGSEVLQALGEGRFSSRLENVASPGRSDSLDGLFSADVWVEFSSPSAVLRLIREAIKRGSKIPLIVAATGWTNEELKELETAAKEFPILRAANFSLGVQICRLTLQLWRSFPELADWTVSIRELHHTQKKDSPSGTALSLQEAMSREVPILSQREGDSVGTHEVLFENGSEKLVLLHEAKSRTVFAEGALEAAIRLVESRDPLPKRLLSLDDLYLRRDA